MRRLLSCAALLAALLAVLSPAPSVLAQSYGDAAVNGLLTAANARAPIYALNFTSDPAAAVGSPRAFTWALSDPTDSATSQYHQGVVLLNGTTNSWVDLSTTSSVNSAGVALPVFGGNNGSYSFEVVFKLPAAITGSWPKVFFLGNGAGNDDVVMTFNGNVPGFTTMNLPLAFQIYNSPSTAAYHYAIRNFLKPVVVGQWYHVVVEVVSDPTVAFGGANWYVWVNGVQVAWSGTVLPSAPGALYTSFEGAAFVNNAANRTLSYLGKSEFNDANAGITIDAFRVYDYALPASLIPQLAAAYGVLNQAMQPNTSLTIPVSAEDTQALAALQGTKAPIFSASFGTNPATLPGLAQLNYVWNASDPTDLSSVASYHTGVVVLNGASTSYIDLSTVSGPQSCGQLLPIFGGAGSGTFGSTQGVTFEMVMKLTATETWSKVFDLASQGGGDGAYDIFGVSWDGNAGQTGQLEIQAYNGLNSTWTSAQPQVLSQLPFVTPTIGAWMHVAVVMTNTDPRLYSMGNWQVYVNGVPTANATGFNMPLPVYRPYAFLGASAWSDAPAPVTFDAFRIYDYTLTQAQVQRLAAVYGLSAAASASNATSGDAAVQGLLNAANARQPIYSLNFTQNPATVVGSPRAFNWAVADPLDQVNGVAAYHQGVVLLNGTTNSWVDLSTTSSVNSAGVALPVFGGNNGSYSFEVVFKLPAAITGSWPKVFFLGNGAGNDDVVMTFNGNVPGFTTMNLPLAFQIYNSPSTAAYHYAIRNFLKPVVVGQWYHVVVEVVSDPTVAFGGANWYVWVNGVQVAWSGTVLPSAPGALYTSFEGAAFVNNAANRTLSYLGKSEFNDANAGITIDAFRVYDYALPASLIPQLAAAYGVLNQAMQPNTSLTIPVSAEDTQALAALQGTKAPIFSASFGTNPATLPGLAQLNYVWNASDPTDLSSVASYHTGVVVLNGASTSYIDLSTVSGPQSCGQLLPIFGGAGSGTFGSTQGVTFEMVMKLTATETWSKVFDLASQGGGDGAYDIFGVSWDGNAGQTGQLEIQAYNGLNSTWTSAQPQVLSQLPFVTPTIGAWMHVAVVMTNTDPRLYSMGNWQVYVNGVPTANATGFNMPLPVYRPYAFLGASAWSDAPAPVTFDAFRIYDYTLTQAQVQRLAAVYGLSAAASASNATSGDAAVQGLLNAANARQPIYSLNFTQNPATVVGSPRAFNWAVADPLDQVNGVAAYHQGVVLLNGTTNSWVDLSTTSSVNSAGVALPVFGGNNGSYSFEVVFKLPAAITGSWPKVFFLGNGAGNDDVVMTFNGNVPGFTTMNLPLAFQIYNSPSTAAYHYAIRNFLKPVVVGQWYHVVVEVVSDPTVAFGGANWYVWVNGVQVAWSGTVLPSAPGALYTSFEGAAFVNNAANRTLSYLGKSEFNDANAGITIDAFRVYDYALPASLIPQLAAAYGVLNQAMQPNTSLTIPVSAEDTQALAALQGTKAPIFSASFGTNPATLPGLAQLNYVWNASDPTDLSSVASYHTGVVVLNGASTSYIDLSTVSGPQSCGQLLPIFGGAGSGTFGSTQGVTFEMVMKLTATETWSKVFDLASQGGGDGAYDIFGVSWDGNAGQTGQLEIQAYNGLNSTWTSAQPQVLSQLPFVTPTIGAWMHVAVVMTNTDPRLYSMGNWQVYVNGVPTANATGFNMPLPVYRPYAFLGASAWSDAPAPVTFDAFRIYDYTLTQAQVQRLAAVYGLSAAASASNATSGDAAVQGLLNAANARQPIYSLNFTQNPATVVGSPRAFNWAVADPLDQVNGVAAYHQGVVLLNGTTNSWVDLSTTSSVNSAGVALPVFGGNNGSYSFEVVFKLPAAITGSWPKVFFLGNGAGNDDVVMTFNGNVPGFTTMNLPLAFQIYNSPSTAAYHYAIRNFLKPVVVGQWYHVVVEVVSDPTVAFGGANWYVWVNGVQVAWSGTVLPSAPGALYTSFEGAAFVNNAANRTLSYLGKSEFNDANAGITIDAFRVYDYALPASLIPQLAAAYGVLNQAMQPNTSLTIPVSAEDTQALAALQGTKAPIFSASFGTNPATLPGLAQLNYVWNASDPTDLSSVASYHTGVVVLNGASTSYIDLSTVSGPQSCGQLLPIFGGAGSGTFGSTQGVTFEMVMKLTATETWSKVFDLASQGGGDGAYDIFGVSWDGNAGQTGQLEIQAYNGLNSTWTSAQPQVLSQLPFVTPTIGAWMHVAVVMTNTDPRLYSMGNWQVYVNGVPTANATGFNMPLPVYRPYAFLGASAWSDAPAPVTFDAFRIYDYTLTQAQVQRLAAVYGLSNVQTNASYSYPLSQEDIAANAAVPIPPVFRASFPSNPASVVGVPATTLNYQWVANDGSNHPGVVQLSGSSLSYIDLNTNAGTNSVGLVLPVIGGAGNYAYGQPNQGWTFETVVKFNGSSGNGVWEKAWFVGNGGAIDDICQTHSTTSHTHAHTHTHSLPTADCIPRSTHLLPSVLFPLYSSVVGR